MTDIGFTILGIGIGYFWAMWRVDNIKITGFKVYNNIDMKDFWQQAEDWRRRKNEEEQ